MQAAELCKDNNSLILFAGGKALAYLSLAMEVPRRVSVVLKLLKKICITCNKIQNPSVQPEMIFMGSKNLMHLPV